MSSDDSWLVVCLCAAWCRSCDEYRPVFDALALEFSDWRFAWVDIEDQSELIDDFDVEIFPALLMGRGPTLCFAGPLTPQRETLARLLSALHASAGLVAALAPKRLTCSGWGGGSKADIAIDVGKLFKAYCCLLGDA